MDVRVISGIEDVAWIYPPVEVTTKNRDNAGVAESGDGTRHPDLGQGPTSWRGDDIGVLDHGELELLQKFFGAVTARPLSRGPAHRKVFS